MKTLQHKTVGNLKRRSDLEAATMVATGDWKYVPKSVWKEQVRDVNKSTETSDGKKKHNKLSKAAKRHMRKK
jgi:hypothetical protein